MTSGAWVLLLLLLLVVGVVAQAVVLLLLTRRIQPPARTDHTLLEGQAREREIIPEEIRPSLGGVATFSTTEAKQRAVETLRSKHPTMSTRDAERAAEQMVRKFASRTGLGRRSRRPR